MLGKLPEDFNPFEVRPSMAYQSLHCYGATYCCCCCCCCCCCFVCFCWWSFWVVAQKGPMTCESTNSTFLRFLWGSSDPEGADDQLYHTLANDQYKSYLLNHKLLQAKMFSKKANRPAPCDLTSSNWISQVKDRLKKMGHLQPMNIFLRQEIDRLQKVITTVRNTLQVRLRGFRYRLPLPATSLTLPPPLPPPLTLSPP